MVDEYGIVSLAPILLDTLDPVCQATQVNSEMSKYQNMDDYQKSKALEDTITHDEYIRAQALETILKYDAMVKARETKEQIMQKILNLLRIEKITLVPI